MNIVFLGIGTNLGDKSANLEGAVSRIDENIGRVIKSSSIYETEPWGFKAEEQFNNMIVEVETKRTPSEVLGAILMIEAQMGRTRSGDQYSSRLIDIDILLYDDLVMGEEALKIPHPLLHERKFVLVPLCEIAPDLVHPVFKKTVATLLKLCADKSNVRRYLTPF